jgi:hypothetical protein
VHYSADPRVDAYISGLPDWQQDICRDVRELVHAADPEVTETIKRTTQPYFVLQGNICALLAAKDHVNVFLYDGAIVPDPDGIITAGHGNKTARTVAIRQGETINAAALGAMFRQIIANNRVPQRRPVSGVLAGVCVVDPGLAVDRVHGDAPNTPWSPDPPQSNEARRITGTAGAVPSHRDHKPGPGWGRGGAGVG